jgi:serine/threonine-protein kinase
LTRCQHCGAENADGARFCGACGQAVAATEPTRPGDAPAGGAPLTQELVGREIAGRYRILAKLGEGGMGAVYRGEQISLKRRCAIKLLRPELSGDAGLVRRFNAEAELAAKLSHPNTVNIIDFGQDGDGTLFIAMEYVEGKSLRQVVSTEGPLPPRRVLHIASQVAASIADAHHKGIVHRDLKPDNVMLTERGRDKDVVRVLDFGIAKLRDEQNKAQTQNPMTRQGDLVGTPQYMAPEQIRGEEVDGRTDVYALGTIVYEMVTGRLPFEGPSLMAILSRHLLDTPEPPTRRRPDLALPPAIDGLVMEMLAKEPARRPASMDAVSERIAQVAAEIGAASAVAPAQMPPPTGAYAAPTSRAMFRPPGVPTTYPPGAMAPLPTPAPPPPYTPTPYTPPASAPPYPAMAPPSPYPMMPAPAPLPPRQAAGVPGWVWILVALLVAGLIAAGIAVAVQQKDADDKSSGDPDDEPSRPIEGERVAMDAYEVTLPAGLFDISASLPEVPPDGTGKFYTGAVDGNDVSVMMFSSHGDLSQLSPEDLEEGCGELASRFLAGSMTGATRGSGKHGQRIRCSIDSAAQKWEGAIYTSSSGILAIFIGSSPDEFDAIDELRDELFDRRVRQRSP